MSGFFGVSTDYLLKDEIDKEQPSETDVNEPDINTLKKICFLFGVHMDDLAKEVITKMETYEKKEKRQLSLRGCCKRPSCPALRSAVR